jgi:D-sedoheptulose 7-phosphate isomerase
MKIDMNYETKYLESIQNGLEETLYEINKKATNKEVFFNELVSLTALTKTLKGRFFFIGNGASSAFSNHMALDWSKNGGVYSVSLSDSALLTALSNDYSYEEAFVRFLQIQRVNKNDIVITVSSSGNSNNIVNVLNYCKTAKIKTVGFSGLKDDNKTRSLANFSLYVAKKTYGIVECIHQVFLHLWLDKSMDIYEWQRDDFQNMNSKEFKL